MDIDLLGGPAPPTDAAAKARSLSLLSDFLNAWFILQFISNNLESKVGGNLVQFGNHSTGEVQHMQLHTADRTIRSNDSSHPLFN